MFKHTTCKSDTMISNEFWEIKENNRNSNIISGAQPDIFQGKAGFVKLGHSNKEFVKNSRKKSPAGKIARIDSRKITVSRNLAGFYFPIVHLITGHANFRWKHFMKTLTLFRMDLFRAAHGWTWKGGRGGGRISFSEICHTYPTIIKLGIVIPYLKKIQNMHKTSVFFHQKTAIFYIKKYGYRSHFNT